MGEKPENPSSDHWYHWPAVIKPLCLILFVGCMSIIFYFQVAHENWLNPLAPEFRIYSAAVSPCPLAPTPPSAANRYHSLTATWNFNLVFANPNTKLDLYYESLQADLFYGDEKTKDKLMLATTPLPLLALTTMTQTTFNVTFATARAYVSDEAAKELIISSNSSSAGDGCYGSAKLGVKLTGFFRIDKSLWFSSYFCDLSPPNYNVTDQSSECEIYNPAERCVC
ncbi:hypothetical protein ACFX1Q_045115 [Malus domestica]